MVSAGLRPLHHHLVAAYASRSAKVRQAENGSNSSGNGAGGNEGTNGGKHDGSETNLTTAITSLFVPSSATSASPTSSIPLASSLQHLSSDAVALSPSMVTAVILSLVAALVGVVVLSLLIYWRRQERIRHSRYLVPRIETVGLNDTINWGAVQGYTTIGIEVIDPSMIKAEYYTLLDQIKQGSLPLDVKPYVVPFHDPLQLSSQLKEFRVKRIRRSDITLQTLIHSGRFGTMHQGLWQNYTEPFAVAVKALKPGAPPQGTRGFFQEAAILGQFMHPNVVRIFGLVNDGGETIMVLELLSKGSLEVHLATLRPDPGELCPLHTPGVLLQLCQQIVLGMYHLSGKGFVHCDLTTKNVLVSGDGICKIANLEASLEHTGAKGQPSCEAPVVRPWEAPEVVLDRSYSSAGDVWSFGNIIHEIWSLGRQPLLDDDSTTIRQWINAGHRLTPPPGCPPSIYSLMIQCWHPDPLSRPLFSDTLDYLALQSQAMLLKMPDSEETLPHPLARVLSGPLEAGLHLYPDLQHTYVRGEGHP